MNTGNWENSTNTPITGTNSLRHGVVDNDIDHVYSPFLASLDLTQGTTTWQFNLQTGPSAWEPSTANRFLVYLMSDATDLTSVGGVANGYAVGVEFGGSVGDNLTLYRVDNGGATVLLSSGTDDFVNNQRIGVEVIRNNCGEWTFKFDANGNFDALATVGTVTDDTHTSGDYFGMYFQYTTNRVGKLSFDDISVEQCMPDATSLAITTITPTNCITANQEFIVEVCPMNEAEIVGAYTTPIQIDYLGSGILTELSNIESTTCGCRMIALSYNQAANLEVEAVSGSLISPVQTVEISPICNVYISELSANTGTADGTASEWIELYNPTDAPIDISCWLISDSDWIITFPTGTIISGGDYFIIGNNSQVGCANCDYPGILFDLNVEACVGCYQGPMVTQCGSNGTVTIPNLTLNNDTEQIVLLDPTNSLTIPVDAIEWGGGAGLPKTFNSTPTDATCTDSYSLTIPSATDPTYWRGHLDEVGSGGVSSGIFVDGQWIIDKTPTPGFANDDSAYSFTINGVTYDLGPLYELGDISTLFSDNAQGTTQKTTNYTFVDKYPLDGVNYYRLRQVDIDATTTYSHIVVIQFRVKTVSIDVLPNIAMDDICLVVNKVFEENVLIEVYDVLGRRQMTEYITANTNELSLNIK